MKQSWLPAGSSDPISYTCTCPAGKTGDGLILLFYRYFAAPPPLPSSHHTLADDPSQQASFHTALTQKLNIGGKIRVAKEGFNVTVGGTKADIEDYIKECSSHWSFAGLDLSSTEKRDAFFKPTAGGCACAFGGAPASVRITSEITPMGVTNYPEKWDEIESLSPAEFHERCHCHPQTLLLDVRNHYESRIGYFIDPKTGEPALRPPIRRFSQWPQYVKKYMTGTGDQAEVCGRQIMTYCTGGIRLDDEIKHGRKQQDDSLFKGKNYVFDARGSTGLSGDALTDPVSGCHVCGKSEDRLSKCRSKGCHLILVVCETCEHADFRCCKSCQELEVTISDGPNPDKKLSRAICDCEQQREALLWGADRSKDGKERQKKSRTGEDINILSRLYSALHFSQVASQPQQGEIEQPQNSNEVSNCTTHIKHDEEEQWSTNKTPEDRHGQKTQCPSQSWTTRGGTSRANLVQSIQLAEDLTHKKPMFNVSPFFKKSEIGSSYRETSVPNADVVILMVRFVSATKGGKSLERAIWPKTLNSSL
ncbi:uncharacterized protein PAC_03060 [Phialocephala subalpina]|uniref:Rhodanese domain-containing protein n=1 Tax=Phialocephala subalpina TaxID=576137 RepID=A0A1L7WK73_9HELO|nr:uncharacterized protein PAC_03060 [Phialocephala subalpina]